ncbi:putative hydrolase of the HAD superfamily [Bryocella elongata]|uniref:Putative hydrolase of the HAD superfamily n=1 Tax=Bryocella elongata TaxID=863522 RepID=A0A1H5UAU3_9BACT|nr:HAD family phosphatase [Bryocella elongata]SEF72212.1 putative hydrolase of the HAD superfamily [Bryocella elongata]
MPSSQPIRAVLFDYGQVLSTAPVPAAWERLKAVFGADEEAFHTAYWRHRHDYDRGTLNADTYWSAVASDLGRTITAEQEETLRKADTDLWTQLNEPMVAWAGSLPARGLKRGILSNIGDAMEHGVLERCPWLKDFDHLTFSHRLKIAKPEAAIYEHAAQGLGVAPEEILFLDDRAENIAAARAAGMRAIQYTDHAAFIREIEALGLA